MTIIGYVETENVNLLDKIKQEHKWKNNNNNDHYNGSNNNNSNSELKIQDNVYIYD